MQLKEFPAHVSPAAHFNDGVLPIGLGRRKQRLVAAIVVHHHMPGPAPGRKRWIFWRTRQTRWPQPCPTRYDPSSGVAAQPQRSQDAVARQRHRSKAKASAA